MAHGGVVLTYLGEHMPSGHCRRNGSEVEGSGAGAYECTKPDSIVDSPLRRTSTESLVASAPASGGRSFSIRGSSAMRQAIDKAAQPSDM